MIQIDFYSNTTEVIQEPEKNIHLEYAIKMFENFPWKEEIEKMEGIELPFAASIAFHAPKEEGSSINIYSFENNLFHIDFSIIFKKSFWKFRHKDATFELSDISKEEVKEFIKLFFRCNREEMDLWINEQNSRTSGST